jgi:hypothetical protein
MLSLMSIIWLCTCRSIIRKKKTADKVFFFFWCSAGHLFARGVSPCSVDNSYTGRKCCYALAASRPCVGLLGVLALAGQGPTKTSVPAARPSCGQSRDLLSDRSGRSGAVRWLGAWFAFVTDKTLFLSESGTPGTRKHHRPIT